jgi:hypothetical protein
MHLFLAVVLSRDLRETSLLVLLFSAQWASHSRFGASLSLVLYAPLSHALDLCVTHHFFTPPPFLLQINCHPQSSDVNNEFVVIHNGIITNFKEIKTLLTGKVRLLVPRSRGRSPPHASLQSLNDAAPLHATAL